MTTATLTAAIATLDARILALHGELCERPDAPAEWRTPRVELLARTRARRSELRKALAALETPEPTPSPEAPAAAEVEPAAQGAPGFSGAATPAPAALETLAGPVAVGDRFAREDGVAFRVASLDAGLVRVVRESDGSACDWAPLCFLGLARLPLATATTAEARADEGGPVAYGWTRAGYRSRRALRAWHDDNRPEPADEPLGHSPDFPAAIGLQAIHA